MVFHQNTPFKGNGSALDYSRKLEAILKYRKAWWVLCMPNFTFPSYLFKNSVSYVFLYKLLMKTKKSLKFDSVRRKSGVNSFSTIYVVKSIKKNLTVECRDYLILAAGVSK